MFFLPAAIRYGFTLAKAGKEESKAKQTEFSGFSEERLIDSMGEESKGFSSDVYEDKDIAICDIK